MSHRKFARLGIRSLRLLAAGVIIGTAVESRASVTLTQDLSANPYTESFDGDLGTSSVTGAFSFTVGTQALIPGTSGWDGAKVAGTGPTNMSYTVGTGTGTGGGIYSFGATGSTERALGALASGTNIAAFGVELINNTGATINNVSLNFTAETWRTSDQSSLNVLSFGYLVGASGSANYLTTNTATAVAGLNAVEPQVDVMTGTSNAAVNGNLAANQTAANGTLLGINWAPGTSLYLRWQDANDTGDDAGIGIDNLSLKSIPIRNLSWNAPGGTGVWDTTTANWTGDSTTFNTP